MLARTVKKTATVACAALAVSFVAFVGSAHAVSAPTGLHQTGDTSSTIECAWEDNGCDWYHVEYCKEGSGVWRDRWQYSSRRDTISSLDSGSTYRVRVRTYYEDSKGNERSVVSKEVKMATSPEMSSNDEVKLKDATSNSATFFWEKAQGATSYDVYLCPNIGSYCLKKMASVTTNSCTVKGLLSDMEYRVVIRANRKVAETNYVAWEENNENGSRCVWTLPEKITGVSFDSWSDIEACWNGSKNVDGYQLKVTPCKGKGFGKPYYITIDNRNDNSCALTKLSAKRFYRVQVRSYSLMSNNDKRYSAWSTPKYTTKTTLPKVKKAGSRKVKASWKKVSGATSYTLYAAKSGGSWKKVKTTKKTSCVVSKYGKSKLKRNQTYSFLVVANKKVGSKTFKAKRLYTPYQSYTDYFLK